MKRPLIRGAMTPFPWSVDEDAPLTDARREMLAHRVRHLPVMRGHELAGLITDRDIKLVLGPEFDYPDPRELRVRDALVNEPYIVDAATPLDVVLLEMAERHIGAALVTSHGRLAGIFTATDACRQYGESLRDRFAPPDGNDAA